MSHFFQMNIDTVSIKFTMFCYNFQLDMQIQELHIGGNLEMKGVWNII